MTLVDFTLAGKAPRFFDIVGSLLADFLVVFSPISCYSSKCVCFNVRAFLVIVGDRVVFVTRGYGLGRP